ncbi:DUF58 domain-containing protein [Pseudomonadota bacterium]|nr:DUF58 domain-containing protein [Pseudomonadota bacterium]
MNSAVQTNNDLVSVRLETLIDLAKATSMLKLRRNQIQAGQSGEYVSRFKGRGMEFDEARVYQAGDDIRSIDWRVTARSDKTYTKIYREERERPVFISVDYRSTMAFATRGVFKSVQAAKIAALLAWSAQANGDRIGGQIFNDQGCQEIKPKGGKHAVLHFLSSLVKPNYFNDDTMSLEQVLARLVQHTRPGSLIYVISDFRGLNAAAELHLSKLGRHCEVVLIHIYDPLESQLPAKGRFRFTDALRDIIVDSSDTQRITRYQQRFQQQQDHLQALSKKWRMTLLQCSTNDDPLEVIR